MTLAGAVGQRHVVGFCCTNAFQAGGGAEGGGFWVLVTHEHQGLCRSAWLAFDRLMARSPATFPGPAQLISTNPHCGLLSLLVNPPSGPTVPSPIVVCQRLCTCRGGVCAGSLSPFFRRASSIGKMEFEDGFVTLAGAVDRR